MKNILNLIEKFLYTINDRHSEVMCAKYGRSRINDACTVCLADFVSLPAKVVQLTAFFSKKKAILCTAFVLAVGRLTSQIVLDITTSKLNIYI